MAGGNKYQLYTQLNFRMVGVDESVKHAQSTIQELQSKIAQWKKDNEQIKADIKERNSNLQMGEAKHKLSDDPVYAKNLEYIKDAKEQIKQLQLDMRDTKAFNTMKDALVDVEDMTARTANKIRTMFPKVLQNINSTSEGAAEKIKGMADAMRIATAVGAKFAAGITDMTKPIDKVFGESYGASQAWVDTFKKHGRELAQGNAEVYKQMEQQYAARLENMAKIDGRLSIGVNHEKEYVEGLKAEIAELQKREQITDKEAGGAGLGSEMRMRALSQEMRAQQELYNVYREVLANPQKYSVAMQQEAVRGAEEVHARVKVMETDLEALYQKYNAFRAQLTAAGVQFISDEEYQDTKRKLEELAKTRASVERKAELQAAEDAQKRLDAANAGTTPYKYQADRIADEELVRTTAQRLEAERGVEAVLNQQVKDYQFIQQLSVPKGYSESAYASLQDYHNNQVRNAEVLQAEEQSYNEDLAKTKGLIQQNTQAQSEWTAEDEKQLGLARQEAEEKKRLQEETVANIETEGKARAEALAQSKQQETAAIQLLEAEKETAKTEADLESARQTTAEKETRAATMANEIEEKKIEIANKEQEIRGQIAAAEEQSNNVLNSTLQKQGEIVEKERELAELKEKSAGASQQTVQGETGNILIDKYKYNPLTSEEGTQFVNVRNEISKLEDFIHECENVQKVIQETGKTPLEIKTPASWDQYKTELKNMMTTFQNNKDVESVVKNQAEASVKGIVEKYSNIFNTAEYYSNEKFRQAIDESLKKDVEAIKRAFGNFSKLTSKDEITGWLGFSPEVPFTKGEKAAERFRNKLSDINSAADNLRSKFDDTFTSFDDRNMKQFSMAILHDSYNIDTAISESKTKLEGLQGTFDTLKGKESEASEAFSKFTHDLLEGKIFKEIDGVKYVPKDEDYEAYQKFYEVARKAGLSILNQFKEIRENGISTQPVENFDEKIEKTTEDIKRMKSELRSGPGFTEGAKSALAQLDELKTKVGDNQNGLKLGVNTEDFKAKLNAAITEAEKIFANPNVSKEIKDNLTKEIENVLKFDINGLSFTRLDKAGNQEAAQNAVNNMTVGIEKITTATTEATAKVQELNAAEADSKVKEALKGDNEALETKKSEYQQLLTEIENEKQAALNAGRTKEKIEEEIAEIRRNAANERRQITEKENEDIEKMTAKVKEYGTQYEESMKKVAALEERKNGVRTLTEEGAYSQLGEAIMGRNDKVRGYMGLVGMDKGGLEELLAYFKQARQQQDLTTEKAAEYKQIIGFINKELDRQGRINQTTVQNIKDQHDYAQQQLQIQGIANKQRSNALAADNAAARALVKVLDKPNLYHEDEIKKAVELCRNMLATTQMRESLENRVSAAMAKGNQYLKDRQQSIDANGSLIQMGVSGQTLQKAAKAAAAGTEPVEVKFHLLSELDDQLIKKNITLWESIKRGAKEGSVEMEKAEIVLKALNEEYGKRGLGGKQSMGFADAKDILTNPLTHSTEEYNKALAYMQQRQKEAFEAGHAGWKQYGALIDEAKRKQEEFGLASKESTMTKQYRDAVNDANGKALGNLSDKALQEQLKYWQEVLKAERNAEGGVDEYKNKIRAISEQIQSNATKDIGNMLGKSYSAGTLKADDLKSLNAAQVKEMQESINGLLKSTNTGDDAAIKNLNADLKVTEEQLKKLQKDWMSTDDAKKMYESIGNRDALNGTGLNYTVENLERAKKALEEYGNTKLDASSQEYKDNAQQVKALDEEIKRLKKEMSSSSSGGGSSSGVTKELSPEKFDALKRAAEQGSGALRQFFNAGGEGKNLNGEMVKVKLTAKELQMGMKQWREEAVNDANMTTDAMAKVGLAIGRVDKLQKELTDDTKNHTSTLANAIDRLKNYVLIYVGFQQVADQVIGELKKNFELSDEMANVQKVTSMTNDEISRLSQNLTELDSRTSHSELMKLAFQGGKMGFGSNGDVEGLTDFVQTANQLNSALGEDFGGTQAIASLAKLTKVMQVEKKENISVNEAMMKTGSAILELGNNSIASYQKINQFATRMGGIAMSAKITMPQLLALGSTLDTFGAQSEMAATAMTKFIAQMIKQPEVVARAVGASEEEMQKLIWNGKTMDAMQLVFDSLKKNGADLETIAGNLKDLVGGGNNTRALQVLTEMANGADTLREHLKMSQQAFDNNVNVSDEYIRMNNTAAASVERIGNAITEAFANDQTANGFNYIFKKLADFVTGIENLKTAFGLFVVWVWTMIKVYSGRTWAMISAHPVWYLKAWTKTVFNMKTLLNGLKAVWAGLGKALLSAGIGLAVGFLLEGVYKLVSAFTSAKDKVNEFKKSIHSMVAQDFNSIDSEIADFTDKINKLGKNKTNPFQGISDGMHKSTEEMKKTAAALNTVSDDAGKAADKNAEASKKQADASKKQAQASKDSADAAKQQQKAGEQSAESAKKNAEVHEQAADAAKKNADAQAQTAQAHMNAAKTTVDAQKAVQAAHVATAETAQKAAQAQTQAAQTQAAAAQKAAQQQQATSKANINALLKQSELSKQLISATAAAPAEPTNYFKSADNQGNAVRGITRNSSLSKTEDMWHDARAEENSAKAAMLTLSDRISNSMKELDYKRKELEDATQKYSEATNWFTRMWYDSSVKMATTAYEGEIQRLKDLNGQVKESTERYQQAQKSVEEYANGLKNMRALGFKDDSFSAKVKNGFSSLFATETQAAEFNPFRNLGNFAYGVKDATDKAVASVKNFVEVEGWETEAITKNYVEQQESVKAIEARLEAQKALTEVARNEYAQYGRPALRQAWNMMSSVDKRWEDDNEEKIEEVRQSEKYKRLLAIHGEYIDKLDIQSRAQRKIEKELADEQNRIINDLNNKHPKVTEPNYITKTLALQQSALKQSWKQSWSQLMDQFQQKTQQVQQQVQQTAAGMTQQIVQQAQQQKEAFDVSSTGIVNALTGTQTAMAATTAAHTAATEATQQHADSLTQHADTMAASADTISAHTDSIDSNTQSTDINTGKVDSNASAEESNAAATQKDANAKLATKEQIDYLNQTYGTYLGFLAHETTTQYQLAEAIALVTQRRKEDALVKGINAVESNYDQEHQADDKEKRDKLVEGIQGGGGLSRSNASNMAAIIGNWVDKKLKENPNYNFTNLNNVQSLANKELKQVVANALRTKVNGKWVAASEEKVNSYMNSMTSGNKLFNYVKSRRDRSKTILEGTQYLQSELYVTQSNIRQEDKKKLNEMQARVNAAKKELEDAKKRNAEDATIKRLTTKYNSALKEYNGFATQEAERFNGTDAKMYNYLMGTRNKNGDVVKPGVIARNEDLIYQNRRNAGWLKYQNIGTMMGDEVVEGQRAMLKNWRKVTHSDKSEEYVKEYAGQVGEDFKNFDEAKAWTEARLQEYRNRADELDITIEGAWKSDKNKKTKTKKGKTSQPNRDESQAMVAELDRYYETQKTVYEGWLNKEKITKEQYDQLMDQNEAEHLKKRQELRSTFTKKIYDADTGVMRDMTDQEVKDFQSWWEQMYKSGKLEQAKWDVVAKEWVKTSKMTHEQQKALDEAIKKNNLDAQKDLTAMEKIYSKHVENINKIFEEDNPFLKLYNDTRADMYDIAALVTSSEADDWSTVKQKEEQRISFLMDWVNKAYTSDAQGLIADIKKHPEFSPWAAMLEENPKVAQAIVVRTRNLYDQIQDAVKKEANRMKHDTDYFWNFVGDDGKSLKDRYEEETKSIEKTQHAIEQYNSAVGGGYLSQKQGDKVALAALKSKLKMQQDYLKLLRAEAEQHVRNAEQAVKDAAARGEDTSWLKQQLTNTKQAYGQIVKEQTTAVLEAQSTIDDKMADMNSKTIQYLKSWGEWISQSIQSVMTAYGTEQNEKYTQLAVNRYTGQGETASQVYIVDNAGTKDASVHTEMMTENEQLLWEIEEENREKQQEAWKQVLDTFSEKLNDHINDMLTAAQDHAITEANTTATNLNTTATTTLTGAINGLTAAIGGKSTETPSAAVSTKDKEGAPGSELGATKSQQDFLTEKLQSNGTVIYNETTEAAPITSGEDVAAMMSGAGGDAQSFAMQKMYGGGAAFTAEDAQETIANIETVSEAVDEMGMTQLIKRGNTELDETTTTGISLIDQSTVDATITNADAVAEHVTDAMGTIKGISQKTNKTMTTDTQKSFSTMMQACNLYGIAYSAMSNSNLSATQKMEQLGLQATGQALIGLLNAKMIKTEAEEPISIAQLIQNAFAENPWVAAAIIAVGTAAIGAAMGLASAAVSKGKSQLASVTGASQGKLATGMLTYAKGKLPVYDDGTESSSAQGSKSSKVQGGARYVVSGNDGQDYSAKFEKELQTKMYRGGAHFGIFSEKKPEIVIGGDDTATILSQYPYLYDGILAVHRGQDPRLTMDYGYIQQRMEGLSKVQKMSVARTAFGKMPAFAEGNIDDLSVSNDNDNDNDNVAALEGTGSSAGGSSMGQTLVLMNQLLTSLVENGVSAGVEITGKHGLDKQTAKYNRWKQRNGLK